MTSNDFGERRFSADEVEREQFYKLPKNIVHNQCYKGLSADAKMVYTLLLDRYQLSIVNGWVDDKGKVYIVYTRDDLCEIMGLSLPTVRSIIKQLKDYRLIEENRVGQGHANRIYVLKTIGKYTYPQHKSQTEKNFQSRKKKTFSQEGKNLSPNKTIQNNTNCKNNPSFIMDHNGNPLSSYSEVVDYIKVYSNYDILINETNDNLERELYLSLIQCLAEMICSDRKTIYINHNNVDKKQIVERTQKIICDLRLGYLIKEIAKRMAEYESENKVTNPKAFMKSCLWNGLMRSRVDFESFFKRTGEGRPKNESMIEGRLGYNDSNGRFGLLVSDLWKHEGFHCGETLEVLIEEKWIKTRMEKSWNSNGGEWYLVGTPYHGDLEYIRARIVS